MFIYISFFISIVSTILTYITYKSSMVGLKIIWKLPLIFVIAFLTCIVIICAITVVMSLFFSKKKQYDHVPELIRFWFARTAELLLSLANIHISVHGIEQLEEYRNIPFLVVQNHRSVFDILCSYVTFEKFNPICISKPENLNIPIIGRYIHRMRFLAIDREDPRKAMQTLFQAAKIMQEEKRCIFVYPEGTRNQNFFNHKKPIPLQKIPEEQWLGEFHNGVFKVAQLSDAPIVITTIEGTENIISRLIFRRTNVNITVNKILDPKLVKELRTAQIGEIAIDAMRQQLKNTIDK